MTVRYGAIWAQDLVGTIGDGNSIPWQLPEEQARFKKITLGSPIIMGRRTFESIGRPLPERENVVLSTDLEFNPVDVYVARSTEEAKALTESLVEPGSTIWVIGGSHVYQEFMPDVDQLAITLVETIAPVDNPFKAPALNPEEWTLTSVYGRPNLGWTQYLLNRKP